MINVGVFDVTWIKFRGLFGGIIKMLKAIIGPQYNGKYLRSLVTGILGTTKLNQTLTNVVIPTFDIKNMQPMIFSSFQVCFYNSSYIFWRF